MVLQSHKVFSVRVHHATQNSCICSLTCRHAYMHTQTKAHLKNNTADTHSLFFTFCNLQANKHTQSLGNAQTLEGPASQQGDYKDTLKMIQVRQRGVVLTVLVIIQYKHFC